MLNPRITAHISAGALFAEAALLRFFPPEQYHFYPRCPIYVIFHVYCPGCGATRALAALLHGNFTEALHFNPFVVILLPFFLAYFAATYWNAIRSENSVWPRIPRACLPAICAAALLFAIFRNVLHLSL